MGYQTEFSGQIDLSRELTASEVKTLHDFAEERHGGNTTPHAGFPGFWCNWEATKDGRGIAWNGAEKFYDADEWMQIVIDRFLTPWGVVANGTILAQGEDPGDVWQLRVKDSRVSVVRGRVVFEEAE